RFGLCAERLCQGRNQASHRISSWPATDSNNQVSLVLVAQLLEAGEMPDFQLCRRGFPKDHRLCVEGNMLPASHTEIASDIRGICESHTQILGLLPQLLQLAINIGSKRSNL